MAEQNNNSRGGKDPQKALPPETIPRKVPENYVDEAERIMRALISSGTTVTTSKIRRSEERRVGKECRSRWSPYH